MHPNNELKHYSFLKKKDAAKLGFKQIEIRDNQIFYWYCGRCIYRDEQDGFCSFYEENSKTFLGETYGEVMEHFKGF